jgi:uncharacterized integral membrane protein (TIGR00697 family)
MNELLLATTAMVSALFVVGGWRLGKERLYSVTIVLLILIVAVGGKIVTFFGHETNTGNIFYASVFLATYFIIERYGRREGVYSMWVGIAAVMFFSAFISLTVALIGAPDTGPISNALSVAYAPVSRLALASLCAYVLSQSLNVYLYLRLKDRMRGKYLWVRANVANFVAQILDSAIFFTVAFWGTVSPVNIWDILLTGFVIKVVFMLLTSPLLYLNTLEEFDDGSGSVAIVLRP